MKIITICIHHPLDQFEIFVVGYYWPNTYIPIGLGLITNLTIIGLLNLVVIRVMLINLFTKINVRGWIVIEGYNLVKGITKNNTSLKRNQYFVTLIFLFFFILVLNLIGLIPYSFTLTSSFLVTFFIALSHHIGINLIGFFKHKWKFANIFLPSGVPLVIDPYYFKIKTFNKNSNYLKLSLTFIPLDLPFKFFDFLKLLLRLCEYLGITLDLIIKVITWLHLWELLVLVPFYSAIMFFIWWLINFVWNRMINKCNNYLELIIFITISMFLKWLQVLGYFNYNGIFYLYRKFYYIILLLKNYINFKPKFIKNIFLIKDDKDDKDKKDEEKTYFTWTNFCFGVGIVMIVVGVVYFGPELATLFRTIFGNAPGASGSGNSTGTPTINSGPGNSTRVPTINLVSENINEPKISEVPKSSTSTYPEWLSEATSPKSNKDLMEIIPNFVRGNATIWFTIKYHHAIVASYSNLQKAPWMIEMMENKNSNFNNIPSLLEFKERLDINMAIMNKVCELATNGTLGKEFIGNPNVEKAMYTRPFYITHLVEVAIGQAVPEVLNRITKDVSLLINDSDYFLNKFEKVFIKKIKFNVKAMEKDPNIISSMCDKSYINTES